MATRLKNIVRFPNVAPGGIAVLAHGLNWDDRPLIPDLILVGAPDFTATADAVNVTVSNVGPLAASVDVYVELWHTYERAFGPSSQEQLIPRPFVMGPAGGVLPAGQDFSFAPDSWELIDVPAGLVDQVAPSALSTLFDEVTLNRATSILGIRTRLSEPITAGTLTAKVSINGIATGATIAHTAVLNPSGGGVVFAPGAFPAGNNDRIGILVDTDAAFLPITTDFAAWVEIGVT